MRKLFPLLLASLVACGDGALGGVDGAAGVDGWAGWGDAHGADASVTDDAFQPMVGFGDLSGACGVLDDDEWQSSAPFLFANSIDFGDTGYTADDFDLLSEGGQKIIVDGNAGGNSLMSEVFAYEVLHRCEWADLLKTENEIVYDTEGKITDLLVDIDDRKVGVSVTRAYAYPPDDPYTVAQAKELLEGKLADILQSSADVAPEDAWVRQILQVLAYQPEHAAAVAEAWATIDPALRADTIVMVTTTDGDDGFIYE